MCQCGAEMYEPVLVLNASFEPLNVCNTRRAIGLIVNGKASLVLNGRGEIRTIREIFPRPSIIRLGHMVHRPRPVVKLNRREIFRRDHFTCQYCGLKHPNLTIDHVVPKRAGGASTWENLVTACPQCNHKKGGLTLAQSHMQLLSVPVAPPASAGYRFAHYLEIYREWKTYVEGW